MKRRFFFTMLLMNQTAREVGYILTSNGNVICTSTGTRIKLTSSL